jgi:peptidoglycan/LPS O-acetylase OafA/YrhL
VAALFIAVFHFDIASHFQQTAIVQSSYLFVDFFFVLSGFVIAENYIHKIQNKQTNFLSYISARFRRIYPLHLFVLGLWFAYELCRWAAVTHFGHTLEVQPFSETRTLGSLGQHIGLLQVTSGSESLSWNKPDWSISAIFWTYVFFGLALSRFQHNVPVVTVATCLVTGSVLIIFSPEHLKTTYQFGLIRCLFDFSLGIMFWHHRQFFKKEFSILRASLLEGAALISVLILMSAASGSIWEITVPFVFGFLILILSKEEGAIAKIFRHRFFLFLGLLSYSIYMLHAFIQMLVKLAVRSFFPGLAVQENGLLFLENLWVGDLATLLMLLICILSSTATYNYIEKPGRHFLKTLSLSNAIKTTGMAEQEM